MARGETEPLKGIYYEHQVAPGDLYCIDNKGDAENRIFKKVYNGELPVYKSLRNGAFFRIFQKLFFRLLSTLQVRYPELSDTFGKV